MPLEPRRVVITGLGIVSAIGHSVEAFWENLSGGRSGISAIEALDTEQLRFKRGAEVKGFSPERHLKAEELGFMDRFAQFSVAAAEQAVRDAAVNWTDELRMRTCVVTGTSIGGEVVHDRALFDLYQEKKNRLHPLTIPKIMPNAGTSMITMGFGLTGPAFTISTACASSNHAIGQAFWMLRSGLSDLAVTGGSETPFCWGFLKAWEAVRVVDEDTCRPFSKNRRGMVLGEGGAMLVLETLDSALARGARIYAEITGFGMSADASHITTPNQKGAMRAMEQALADSGIHPGQIGYINAHGTGTQINDAMETGAIRSVFGTHAGKLAVSSTKSMHGHALGASSAMEALATTLALHHGVLPPTANFTEPDPECDLDVIPNEARPQEVGYAMSNAFAFGGLNAVLIFKKWKA